MTDENGRAEPRSAECSATGLRAREQGTSETGPSEAGSLAQAGEVIDSRLGVVTYPAELPTRPDSPAVAHLCKHCRLAYGEHAQTLQPQSSAPCQGTRKGYDRDTSGDDGR